MRIAFVGKGGAGKSTISSLFIRYLLSRNQTVVAIDADINVHLAEMLGASIDLKKALSLASNTEMIREYLRGDNSRIISTGHFIKTTPPGSGSRFLKIDPENFILKNYATLIGQNSYLLHVGTYQEEGIGVSCYHTNLAIFENLLSHAVLKPQEWIVSDMVAGTDAFSNTLHAQFDALFLVVEPTPEGVKVFEQYQGLARSAGIYSCLGVVGNKVEDEDDVAYLKNNVGEKLVGYVGINKSLKKARQNNRLPQLAEIGEVTVFEKMFNYAVYKKRDPQVGLELLHELHRTYSQQDYVVNALGDVTGQIDQNFKYE